MSRSKKTERQIKNNRARRYDYLGDKGVGDKLQEIEFMPSSLETIDGAMLDFINEEMNLSVQSNEGFKRSRCSGLLPNDLFSLKTIRI